MQITRRFVFDAAHRVLGHTGRCRWLHGHRYEVELTVKADSLDHLGMVTDFSVVKDKVGTWINDTLDHNIILHQDDPLSRLWVDAIHKERGSVAHQLDVSLLFGQGKMPVMLNCNPTAENLAALIAYHAHVLLNEANVLRVSRVRVYETENCWAEAGVLEDAFLAINEPRVRIIDLEKGGGS